MTLKGTNGGTTGPLSDTPEGCRIATGALRAFDPPEAKSQLSSILHRGSWTTAASLAFLVLWCVFMVVRYRVLRRRVSRMLCDFVAALLVALATTLFIVGSTALASGRTLPFWKKTYQFLNSSVLPESTDLRAGSYIDQLPVYFLKSTECTGNARKKLAANLTTQAAVDDIKERAQLLHDAQTKSLLYIAASSLAAIAAICLLASIISFILAACVKTVPEGTYNGPNSGVYSAADVTGRSLRARMMRHANRARGEGDGVAYGLDLGRSRRGGRGGDVINDMPATEAIEFFSRFIQKIPPQDGVVLGGGGRGGNGTLCTICLEVLMEDIGRLTACGHDFHRRCILQWLLRADDPKCPICKEPVQLCSAPYQPDVSTGDNNHSAHDHAHAHNGHCDHNQGRRNNGDVNIPISDYNTDTDIDGEGLVNVDIQSEDSAIIPPAPISRL